ncbi:Ig-like domain-containing protein [Clostridium folliculivorans]|uniref:Ig-like domain-containing protein n=1 Tax=Clostridium folliculivorans TaxID=2886038 RepID=A0A9W5Y6X1_9CLOT|nr:Ig-like domain-containing protein [Clostridium folliculivorans]GKU27685.1 hypothetical protein CFOLD11_45120 [Clostridium folliculivorans]GKU32445.1 hypothetical protein CFB3_45530 [Clostridium folliculivorans]
MLNKNLRKKLALSLISAFALSQLFNFSPFPSPHKVVTVKADTLTYSWNNTIPEKTPAAGASNGKLVLFDNSHDETAGAADWVLDGGFSDFADALVSKGYTVREYRGIDKDGDGAIRYYDDRQSTNVDKNEAVITYDSIKNADVFVMAEANRPLTQAEYSALKQFVDSGKGLFFIADHYNSDRNTNTWDSTEVYNGYNRSTDTKYNIGGVYGDMRNPQSATSGWLAQNFGIRYRFNAIDCKNGVSGVKASSYSEGITTGVSPILMAAGSTLAITDPNKAKGIVYFSSTDSPVKWSSAADTGLYFGGENEGPYVAISKPSAGKAAFIGDSSPIEDATPKYLREDTGKAKSTYPGWTDTGNAATLCTNIVNWLSNSESYVGFDGVNHAKGTATPTPMADVEKTQTQAEPWTTPSYDPWNTDNFANGSYGAPYSSSGSSGGGTTTGLVKLSLYPSYVYVNEPFAIVDGGTASNPQIGAYNTSTGTQIGQLLVNGSWTSAGYNTISGTGPLAATIRVNTLASSTTLKLRTSDSSTSDKQAVTGLSSGYGYLQGTIPNSQPTDIVAAVQSGVILGTAQVDSNNQAKIAAKSGSGITLSLYSSTGAKKADLTGTYTVSNSQTTAIGTSTVVPVTSVSLDKTTLSLTTGTSSTLIATVAPSNATNKNVTWTSSNTSVATVQNGTVTAVAAGTATITVTTQDGSKIATCTVTVTAPTSGDTYEPNNSTTSAYPIASGYTLSSYIYSSSDVDYYKLTVTTSKSFTISLTNLPKDYDLTLYDANGNYIDYSENSGTTSETLTDTLSAGTYYIQVVGYNGAYSTTTPYKLTVN